MIKDMTKGSPAKTILTFSLPLLLSMIFQQMYNMADSIIAGKFIGKSALAAVGASFPITAIFLAVAVGASVGCSVIISQLFGLKRLKEMKTAIYTTIISIMIIAVVLTLAGYFVSVPLLKLLKTPESILADSKSYLSIYIFGLPFLFLYNAANSIFTGLGDSRMPLYFLIFSSVFNVILDIIFVVPLAMGVKGVAWATFIAQGMAAIGAIVVLIFRIVRIESPRASIFSSALLKKMLAVALPSILQQSFISVGQLLVQGVINKMGEDAVAAFAAAFKLNVFAVASFTTMSAGLSSFTAQNVGADDFERVKRGYKSALAIIFAVCALFIAAFCIFSKPLLMMFLDSSDASALNMGRMFLYLACVGYPFVACKLATDGVLRGSGDMTAFMISTFLDLIVRVILSFVLAPSLGYLGICLAYPIGWALGMLGSVIFFARGKWKNKIKVR